MIGYRNMRFDDIPAGLSLCRSAGWNQQGRDWELFLKQNPEGCRVALDESGNVIGTVATFRYQHHFTWIGMVLVNPEMRRSGIGTQLLNEALKLIPNNETVKLDATPAGREVYLKLNFVDEYAISRMRIGAHAVENLSASLVRPIQASDIFGILKLDREVFGADRQLVLEWSMQGALQYAFVMEEHSEIKGFCFGRQGYNFNHIGPVIATHVDIAKHLLSAALSQGEGRPAVIDVLDHTTEWSNFLSSLGFTHLRPLIRMYRGTNAYPGLPEKQFAILGPEFG
jgi:GNAT superfamily N-acetyltransferase